MHWVSAMSLVNICVNKQLNSVPNHFWSYYVMEKKCIHKSTFQNMSKSSQDTSHYIGKVQL